jgi:undecaprenyl-diphosphatase
MTGWVQPIIDYLAQNPGMAWFIVFLVSMGEALFVVGLIVPSTAVLVGAGTLVGLGKLQFWPIFAMTIAGAVAGDAISYWFGHIYKDRIKTMWPFSNYPDAIERGVVFMRKDGGKSVFIGRFVPGVKAVVPGLAGMMGMDAWHFTWINIVSAVAWAGAHLFPAILAGAALSFLGTISNRLMIMAAVLIVLLLLVGWIVKWTMLWFSPHIAKVQGRATNKAQEHGNALVRWFGRTFNPDHPRATTMSIAAVVLALALPLVLLIASELGANEPMVLADAAISNFVGSLRTQFGDRVMIAIATLGDGVVLTPVVLVVSAWLALRKAWVPFAGLLTATISAAIFVPAVKLLVHRTRPMEIYSGVSSLSFPSGHATTNTVFYMILAYLVAHLLPRWGQAMVYGLTLCFVTAIGFSRIYLGAHWPTDVAAGLLLAASLGATYVLILGGRDEQEGGLKLGAVAMLALLTFGGWHLATGYDRAVAFYARPERLITVSENSWLAADWKSQPAMRVDLGGEGEEPLTVQIAGAKDALVYKLASAGWQAQGSFALRDFSKFLSVQADIGKLPAVPTLNDGYSPALIFTKSVGSPAGKRLVLRLCQSSTQIANNAVTGRLYIGSVVEEALSSPFSAFSLIRATDGYVASSSELGAMFPGAKLVQTETSIGSAQKPVPIALVPLSPLTNP